MSWEINDQHKAGIAATEKHQAQDGQKLLICIEGNIGVGKSTLTRELADAMGAEALFEPVEANPYLDLFYQDPKRYALEMQFWLMSRRFEMHERAIRHIWRTGQTVIMDRSIYGDWVFAKQNWLDGNISDIGYKAYTHHRRVMDQYLLAPHIILSLEAEPMLCKNRILRRGRDCEKEVSIEYLQGLNRLHDELSDQMERKGSRVVRVNWNSYGSVNYILEKMEIML